ncbi:MAG: beta-glucuronidase, partial [Bacteroidaceae bacterium]|nr:beta-glucuronidase [Bacteroidaceae bacterium]
MMKNISKLLVAASLLLGMSNTVKAVDIPRSEYPRPQFERADWVNLNGTWTYSFDFGQSGADRGWRD